MIGQIRINRMFYVKWDGFLTMSLPTYDAMYSVVLEILSDGRSLKRSEIYQAVAEKLKFSEEDMGISTDSKEPLYKNRIGWSITYLSQAGLLDRVQRATYKISKEGKHAIESGIIVDNDYLSTFDSFRQFKANKPSLTPKIKDDKPQSSESSQTPDERMALAKEEINRQLINDILSEINDQSSDFFEKLVVEVIRRIYGGKFDSDYEVTPRTNDGGIDGIVRQDRLGFNNIYIQAKKWGASIGRPELQKFSGAMDGAGATNGAFIVSSDFTTGAMEFVKAVKATKNIVLINGEELAKLMIEYNLGVQTKEIIEIKKVDYDYFHPDA